MFLSDLNRLLTWTLHNKVVAAISVAGLISAGFLVSSIAIDLGADPAAIRAALTFGPDGADTNHSDDKPNGITASRDNRSSQRRANATGASGIGHVDESGRSHSAVDSGEYDDYIASDAAWRGGTFAASFESGGEPWGSDSSDSAPPDKDSERPHGADYELFDEDSTEEPYTRNEFISGRVMSDSGMALVGIGVTATATHLFDVPADETVPVHDLQRHTTTDSAGKFRFEQLVAGEYRINNMPTETYGRVQIAVRTGVDFADLVLKGQRQLSVSGMVTDTMGQPLAAALVQPQALGSKGAYTDSAGRFELRLQVPTDARGLGVRTTLYGYRSKMTLLAAEQVAEHATTMTIELEATDKQAVVTGVVMSGETNTPLSRKTVQLSASGPQQRYAATTNLDGRFVMPAVEVGGRYELLVAGGSGYAAWLQPNVDVPEQGLDVEIFMEADNSRPLAGRMINLNGMPIPHYNLTVRSQNPPYQTMRITSDAGGNFVIPHPPQGPLVFESRSNPDQVISGVPIPTTDGQQVSLTLDVGRDELYGAVVNTDGAPVAVPNVVVSWRHTQNGITSISTRRAATDSQGQISFAGLGPGIHTITVDADGYVTTRIDHDASQDGYEFMIRLEADPAG